MAYTLTVEDEDAVKATIDTALAAVARSVTAGKNIELTDAINEARVAARAALAAYDMSP